MVNSNVRFLVRYLSEGSAYLFSVQSACSQYSELVLYTNSQIVIYTVSSAFLYTVSLGVSQLLCTASFFSVQFLYTASFFSVQSASLSSQLLLCTVSFLFVLFLLLLVVVAEVFCVTSDNTVAAPPPHPTTVSKRELADRKCCFRNVFHLEVRRIMELTQDVTRCHVSKPEKALPMTSHNVLDGRQRVNDSRPADEVDLNFCVRDAKRRPYTCLKLRCYVGYVPARPVSSGHVATLGSRLRRDLLHQLSCIGGRVT